MRKKNPNPLTPRDKYLRKQFGVDELTVNCQLSKQGNVCAFCGSSPVTRSLHLDHDHKVEKTKIAYSKNADKTWSAWPEPFRFNRLDFTEYGITKAEARAKVKARLLRESLRFFLCYSCNGMLQKARDNPGTLFNAAEKLKQYYEFLDKGDPNLYFFG